MASHKSSNVTSREDKHAVMAVCRPSKSARESRRAVVLADHRPPEIRLFKSLDISDQSRIESVLEHLKTSAWSRGLRELKEPGHSRALPLDDGALALARSLFSSGRSYLFKMSAIVPIASDGSGNLKGTISCSPGTTSFSEATALAGLFGEGRLRWARVRFVSRINLSATSTAASLCLGFNPRYINTAPTSATDVLRLPKNTVLPLMAIGQPNVSLQSPSLNRPFVDTADWVSTDPMGGFTGQFEYMTASTVSNTTTYCDAFLEIAGEFRNRQ